MNTSSANQTYVPDILGTGYEQLTLNFPSDYEGKVVATLVRKRPLNRLKKPYFIFMVFRLFLSN